MSHPLAWPVQVQTAADGSSMQLTALQGQLSDKEAEVAQLRQEAEAAQEAARKVSGFVGSVSRSVRQCLASC